MKSFEALQNKLITTLVLALPTTGEDFVIYSDVSHSGFGCVLMQNGKSMPSVN